MTAEELADRFDISISSARIRLHELQEIQRRKLGVPRALPASIIAFLLEARDKGHPVKSLDDRHFKRVVQDPHQSTDYRLQHPPAIFSVSKVGH
jgi:hypothetical protein